MNKILACGLAGSILSSVSYADALFPQAEINPYALEKSAVNSAWLGADKAYFGLYQTIDICEINNDEFADCKVIVTDFRNILDVIVRSTPDVSVAYIAGKIMQDEDFKNVVYVCSLDNDGYFDIQECAESAADMGEMSSTGLQLHPNNNRLYATNYGAGQITSCALNADGTLDPFTCGIALTINDAGFTGRVAFFENADMPSKLYAYIASYTKHNLYFCEVQEDATFNNCQKVFYDYDPVAYAAGVSVQGNTLYVPYRMIGTFTPAVRVCSIDPSTGAIDIDNCKNNTGDGIFNFSNTVTNLYVNEQWAYIPNSGGDSTNDGNMYVCHPKGLDLNGCVAQFLP